MTSIDSLRQVHWCDYPSDPSIAPPDFTEAHWRSRSLRPHCRNAAAPVPPVKPELAAYLSRVSCDMTEIVQNQPNKTFFSLSKQVQGAPRRRQDHLEQTYLLIP